MEISDFQNAVAAAARAVYGAPGVEFPRPEKGVPRATTAEEIVFPEGADLGGMRNAALRIGIGLKGDSVPEASPRRVLIEGGKPWKIQAESELASTYAGSDAEHFFVGSPDRVIGDDEFAFIADEDSKVLGLLNEATEMHVAFHFALQRIVAGDFSARVSMPVLRPGDVFVTSSTYPSRILRFMIENPGVIVWAYGMNRLANIRGEESAPPSDGQIAIELGLIQQILADYDASSEAE